MVAERKDEVQGRREGEQASFLCEVDRLSDLMGQISKSKMSEPRRSLNWVGSVGRAQRGVRGAGWCKEEGSLGSVSGVCVGWGA